MILLNCDLGESFGPWQMGNDEAVIPLIDCANVACGFHASDPLTMNKTVSTLVREGVNIGAHPAYPDLVGFGRRSMAVAAEEITALVLYQVGALEAIAKVHGSQVSYVKPHGALYHDMMHSDETFKAVLKAIVDYNPELPLVMMATADTSRWQALAEQAGVTLWFEAFADRAYDDEGKLLPRSKAGAVLQDIDSIMQQAQQIIEHESVVSVNGNQIRLKAQTLCVHGDNPQALETAKRIRSLIDQAKA